MDLFPIITCTTGNRSKTEQELLKPCMITCSTIADTQSLVLAETAILWQMLKSKKMRDYLNQVCGSDFEKKVEYVSGSLFFTHENPRKHINSGYPTLITMTSFKSSITVEKQEYHTVVAYGYNKNDDTFLVHMGWYPGRTTGAQVVVSDATIYSYNTFLYSE